MKKQEIERMYTQKVAELLNQGWRVHASTMPGHQGEIAHIDLTDGNEIRRVLLERELAWSHLDDGFHGDRITITVGRNTEQVWPGWDSTIWNQRLEVLSQIEMAEIQTPDRRHPDGWYTDFDEAVRISKIRHARREAQRLADAKELGDAYKSIALRWMRKQPKMKTCKLEDITKMTAWRTSDGHRSFRIEAKGKKYTLRA